VNSLSEQHPREQGLKHLCPHAVTSVIVTFRATSKRTRIETSEGIVNIDAQSTFRATSKRTRIETLWASRLKHQLYTLSEQHPREQGLKPAKSVSGGNTEIDFQSNIQENKD